MEDAREALIRSYCDVNRVSEDLAGYWVDQMTDAEVAEELSLRSKRL